ncbi:E3 ubiquitin-protein ligase TRIM71-like [Lingula anatina]|uniref:E3 ubiquitin-protein ligase TRIM71-like n=1 Tax=Lingula anatina TaxID=7574 RepID=A0A1S3JJ61_LINAN|nr:E3 ubiquitin-protein ligase TRIM71-like [Lingula anatina]|eukprot:XP_013410450.1 E3 ubiquitin-protein ligase TRIM71-like [Lingula anatina]
MRDMLFEKCPQSTHATKRCLDCEESMCGDCSSQHVLHKVCRDHKLFPVDQFDSDEYVKEMRARQNTLCDHNNKDPVEIYCPVCKKFVCVGCMVLEHQGHDCLRINIAADKRKEKLEFRVKSTQKKGLLYDQFKTAAEDQKASVEEGRKKAKTQVEKQLELVITTARQLANNILEEIDAKSNAKLDILNNFISTATANQNRLDDVVAFSRKLINHGIAMDVLQMASACEQSIDSVQTIDIPTLPAAMTQLQLLTNDMEECVANINSCLGRLVQATSGRLVTSFKVDLADCPEEMISHVTTDKNGDILIGIWCDEEKARNRIHIYDNNFVLQGTISNPRATEKDVLGGIVIDDDGNIVTYCRESNEIIVFTKTGDHVRTFHSELPEAVAINSKGHYVVAGLNTLTVHHKDGKVLQTTPDPEEEYLKYIHCNVNDDVIITGDDGIRVYNSNLQVNYRYGTQGDGDGQVNTPCGTCCLDNGDIILTDLCNNRLHLVSPDGKFKQFLLREEDGLCFPNDIVINRLGQLVVGELSGEIRIFEL